MIDGLAERIAGLRAEIDAAAVAAGRRAGSVRLLGVSKRQSRERVLAAIEAGLALVGENYVQEAKAKFAGLPPVERHFIGHVQTNKAKAIVEQFDVVQSIDRWEAGLAVARAADRLSRRQPVLIQINVSPAERFGVAPSEAQALAERLRAIGLEVDGVMAIGPAGADRGRVRDAFALAARTFAGVGGTTLSIGMSGDWREAVAAGSTMIRLGTALFGARA
ncbi:MAG: YggS family pyridoxal phosphate-dependent enzyme [Vulcanimicrobiaceae bacterium]